MTDNLKESLSALIDGEASELEVHRLLRQFESDQSLKPSWVTYQQVRCVVRGEATLSADAHLALQQRISIAIESEEPHAERPPLRKPAEMKRYLAPAAGLAVAASLVVAVFVGQNVQQPTTDPAAGIVDAQPTQVINAQPVTTGPAFQPDTFDNGELRELDEAKQKQLRAYLNQHDRMARMNPNIRTAGFEKAEGK